MVSQVHPPEFFLPQRRPQMNKKTAKMLNNLALLMDVPPKQCKAIWNKLPWNERAKNRDQIWGIIAKQQEQLAQKKADRKKVKEKTTERFLQLVKPYREKEEKAQRKARKLRRKQRQKMMNKHKNFIHSAAAWMGGLIRGKK
jgi:hypothetical protein